MHIWSQPCGPILCAAGAHVLAAHILYSHWKRQRASQAAVTSGEWPWPYPSNLFKDSSIGKSEWGQASWGREGCVLRLNTVLAATGLLYSYSLFPASIHLSGLPLTWVQTHLGRWGLPRERELMFPYLEKTSRSIPAGCTMCFSDGAVLAGEGLDIIQLWVYLPI